MTDDARVVVVEGAHNLRDLGGLPATEGTQTAFGRLYRSDFPRFLTRVVEAPSVNLSLRTVVDLRREPEVAHEHVDGERWGLRYLSRPLVTATGHSWTASYEQYLTTDPATVVDVVRELATPGNQPALFHCAAGKDRTGTIAALLLDLLGVPREVIVHDFEMTWPAMGPILSRLKEEGPYRALLADRTLDDHRPDVAKLERLFEFVDERRGSERWLRDHGMTAAEIDAFRAVMLVDVSVPPS